MVLSGPLECAEGTMPTPRAEGCMGAGEDLHGTSHGVAWHVLSEDSLETIICFLQGCIDENTLVWGQGLYDWLPAKNVKLLLPMIRTPEGK